jgi:Fe-S-cluster formation regulator IscX/YfhJ
MANLQNKRIKDTYEGLIKTDDNNAISGEVELTDGAGNGTGVSVSTDGRVVASGTVSFGSLKDTGENITITKFVDEADGIANNDNDTSIPTVAAVKDYVDSTELDTVTSVNTQTGDVVLDTDDISEGSSNLYYTEARVSANTSVAANTLKNTYPSADATKVGHITVTQAVDLDTLESNVATNNAKISFDSASSTKLAGIESGAEVNPTSTDELSEGSTNLYYTDARVSANSAVAANTAKTGITTQQAADITTNNAKVGITTDQANAITTNSAKVSFPEAPNDGDAYVRQSEGWVSLTHPADAVTSVNGETGVVVLDSDDITEGASNLYYTDARVSANSDVTANTAKVGITTQQAADIVTNNAKVGITTQQASDITTNNAKVGITTAQADAITANTAKNSYPSADATKLAGIEAGAEVNPTSTDELSEGTTNLYYTEARVSANTNVAANTLKNSYPTTDATKVGFISVTQAVDLDTIESDVATNNAKVGITTQQASDITTNNAKISFDSASSTKLAGIEENADVTDTANVTAAGALMDSEVDADIKTLSLPANTTISSFAQSFLDDADAATVRATIGAGTSDFDGAYSSLTGTPTIPTNNNELTNGAGYITDGNTGWDNSYGFITASSTDTLTNKSGNISQWTNDAGYTTNVGTVTNVTVGTGLDVTNGTTTPNVTLDLTEITAGTGLDTTATGISLDLSEFTDMTADMVETDEFIVLDNGAERRKAINEIKSTLFSNNDLYKVIGIATDHGNRVTLDSGTSEGATSIMQNFEILIAN